MSSWTDAHGAGASLDDIARAAGVGNATLYRHFPTRATLLEAVYDQRIAELCAAAAEFADPAAPARALREWLRAVVAHVTDRRVLTDAFLAAYQAAAGAAVPGLRLWDLWAAARSDATVQTWVPNYRDLGRADLTAAELRRRHAAWTARRLAASPDAG